MNFLKVLECETSNNDLSGETGFQGSDQVRHKLACTLTEVGLKLKISDLRRRQIILSVNGANPVFSLRSSYCFFRTFTPFFPLLNCMDSPAVQLWAVWAILHVCTKNSELLFSYYGILFYI